ncbi:MAG: Fic family protein [Planctomycetes bacterium]|nr:Fic family protein [Planctomycetota bacterium]
MASDPHESKGCVEGSLGGAWTAELYATEGDDAIRQGLVFAGYLLFYLAKNHCFGDGNKRTALASMQEVLSVLGLTIDVNDDELVTYVLAVAGGTVKSAPDVVKWLAQRLTELK